MTDAGLINLKYALKKSLEGESPDTVNIINRIHSYCLCEFNFPRLSSILKELFENEPKLLDIYSNNETKVYQIFIENFCDFIINLVKFAKEKLLPFCGLIKNYLMNILKSKKSSAKMKELSIKSLQDILTLTGNNNFEMNIGVCLGDLFSQLQNKSSTTVLSALIELIGKICLLYPNSFTHYSSDYEGIALNLLQKEINNSKTSIISGCCEGLRRFYKALPEKLSAKSPPTIYLLLLKILHMDSGYRFAAVKSCLHFLTDHWANLKYDIFGDTQQIFPCILKHINHNNAALKFSAQTCLDKYLEYIGEQIQIKFANNTLSSHERETFEYLFGQFNTNLKKMRSVQNLPTDKFLDTDIKGLGQLVKGCSVLLPKETLGILYSIIGEYVWKEYLLEKDQEQIRSVLPRYKIYPIADILISLTMIVDALCSSKQFEILQYPRKYDVITRLTNVFIEFSPRLPDEKMYLYRRIFNAIVDNLKAHETVRISIIDKIVYQAIILSCSFPVPPDFSIIQDFSLNISDFEYSINTDSNETDLIKSYAALSTRDFLQFWNAILQSDDDKDECSVLIFDSFMKCAYKIIDQLDLLYKSEDVNNEKINTDPMIGQSASTPKDFIIFVNLCQLFQFVTKFGNENKIKKWASFCINYLVTRSLELPLVSGFYKMICSIIKILDSFGFFQINLECTKVADNRGLCKDAIFYDIKRLICSMLEKICNYNDELLITCLTLLVNSPIFIWIEEQEGSPFNQKCLAYLQMAIQLGNCYLPLGQACLDMLERWIKAFPHMGSWVKLILPSYRTLLLFSPISSDAEYDVNQKQLQEMATAKRGSRKLARTLRSMQIIEQQRSFQAMESEINDNNSLNKLEKLQNRLIRILGKMGINYSRYLIRDNSRYFSDNINWNKSYEPIILYELPFKDIKPDIRLEWLITPISSLALNSTNNQVKSLASEVLHSLIIILLGKTATTILKIENIKFIPTWSYIFTISIKLATDMNKVSKTLFSDLLMQIAYWFSYPDNSDNPAVECFIDSCFDTVIYIPTEDCSHKISIDPNSGNVQRDLAGQLLFYFLKSSFEHENINSDILKKVNRKIKRFLQRIYFLCQNFSPYKRLGAVFIFNSIFPILKNDTLLMENEIFAMMYYLVECQRLSENDKHLGTINQLKLAFKNIGNAARSLKSKLMDVSKSRIVPPSWTAATIEFAIRWLLNYYLSDKRRLRQVCIDLSEQLSFCYDETNPNSFFKALLTAKPLEYITKKFESTELFKIPPSPVNAIFWMNTLEASVQSFCWLLSMNLIDAYNYFTKGVSNLFTAVNNFLILDRQIDSSKDLFQLSVNFISFFQMIFSFVDKPDFVYDFVDANNLMRYFILISLEPSQIYLDVRNRKKVEKWLEKIKALVKAMNANIRLSYLHEISTNLSNYSLLNEIHEISNPTGKYLNSFDIEYMFKFLKMLCLQFSDFNPLTHSIHESIFEKIILATNYEVSQISQVKVYESAALDYILVVENGLYFEKIISMLATTEMHSLFNAHREVLLKNMLLFSEKFVPYLKRENHTFLLPLLLDLLHYGIRNNLTEKKSIVQVLGDNWFQIDPFSYYDPEVNQNNLNLTIDLLLEMMLIDSNICENNLIFDFFCNLLSSTNLLITFKNKIIPAMTHFFKYATQNEGSSFKIIENIKTFFDRNFLALSKDLQSDLSLEECYLNSISAVFHCLQIPCRIDITFMLIKIILIPIFCRESVHPCEDSLKQTLQLLCERLDSEERNKLLALFEDELKLIKAYENIIWFLNKFYFVIILKCDIQNLTNFFGSRIDQLLENIKINNFENPNERELQNVIVNLKIISTIYTSLGPFCNQDKVGLREKKLIGELSKICSLILYCKSDDSTNKLIYQMIYNVRSWAFNCFSSVVIATQSDEKFYANLLLRYNKPLFRHIIYKDYVINFPSELLIFKMKQTKFYTLNKEKPIFNSLKYSSDKYKREPIHSVAEFLSDSSLALDVEKLENILSRNVNSNLMDSDSFLQHDGRCLMIINIPYDIVNDHPCMDTFICLHHQMKNVGIISEVYLSSDVPPWMKVTHDTFFAQDCYIDIKYFIVKLIINCHHIFKPYASFWMVGLIEFLILKMSSINPFVESVLRLIIDWSSVPGVYDKVSKANINLLINWLAENCYSDNPSIVRTNIELFFSLLNLWKEKVDIPYKPIFDNLQNVSKGLRNCCGLKMLAAVLTNGYLFMAGANNDTKFGFIKQLVKILHSTLKTVFGPAFELCGILLKQILKDSDSKSEWVLEIEKEITLTFEAVLARSKSDFVTCLALIGKNHSDIICRQISNLMSILKSLTDNDYCKALELLGCGMRDSNEWLELFNQLVEWNIFENIQYKSSSVICAIIQLFHQAITNIPEWKNDSQINANVVKCFESCLPCSTQDEKKVRSLFFQLFVDLSSEKPDILFVNCFQSALLMGFIDPDKDISQSIRNFCSSSQCLPTETLERSCKILEILFPESNSIISVNKFLNRSKFLAIATNIVLEMTSHCPDFVKPIFQIHLDSTATFENLTASKMNSQTTRSLLPNFVNMPQELRSYSMSHDQKFKVPTSINIPKQAKNFDWIQLASTLQFPSQEINENNYKDEYSMEWSSSQIPGVDMSLSIKSQKSFLNLSTSVMHIENEDKASNQQENQTEFQTINKTIESNYTKELDNDYFREKAVQKQKLLLKKQKIEKNIKNSAVYLYRNYHTGKLPNIKIQNCSFIAPLQMLAQLNEEFSKDLFCHLYNGLLKESEFFPHSGVFEGFCQNLSQQFDNILKTCDMADKNLISSCLQIAIVNISKINLNPSFVYNASTLSGNEVLATVLLEKYLIGHLKSSKFDSNEIPPAKKLKLSETNTGSSLIPYLMKLYKILNLNEEIIGLLEIEQLSSSKNLVEKFKEALKADCFGNYNLSYDLYNSLLSETSVDENNEFEYELLSVSQNGLIDSLKKLCKWTELTKFLNCMIGETLSSQNFEIAKSVVNSKLRTLVFEKNVDEGHTISELDELVKRFQISIPNYELLMPVEISLYYIMKENYNKAQRFCEISYDQILAGCCDYSLSSEADTLMLQSLHFLNEICQFLQAVQKCDMPLDYISKLKENQGDLEKESLEFWENLLFYRTVYLKKGMMKFPFLAEAITTEISDLQMQFIDACIIHNRMSPALSYLKSSKQKSYQGDKNSKLAWCLKYSKVHLRSAICHGSFISFNEAPEILIGLTNSVKLLLKFPNTDINYSLEYLLSLGDCYWTLGNVLSLHWQSEPENKIINSILELIDHTGDYTKDSLICGLLNKSFYCFNKIISMYSESDGNKKELSAALVVVSDFYDAQIRQFENDGPSRPDLIRSYVESTLYSMKLEQFSAKNKFPRLLQIINQHALDIFDFNFLTAIFSSIPSWMYIPWLDQMIPFLDCRISHIVESIISRIADDYPHALFYPFMLYVADVTSKSNFICKIGKILSNLKLVHQFYAALLQMGQPEYYLQAWLDEANDMFSSNSHDSNSRQNIVNKYQDMYRKIIGNLDQLRKGQFQEEFSKLFEADIKDNFREDGTSIYTLTQNQFSEIRNRINNQLKTWKLKVSEFKNLKDFSPWLAKYNFRDSYHQPDVISKDWLEIPGQYNNITARPFPEKHIKIFKLEPGIQIMPSKQCPKKIIIIGDNEQPYSFLVKSGEDLRQDYRIEQMFTVMNDIMTKDYQLTKSLKALSFIKTYNVIPISKSLGLLEWIDNTVTLSDFYRKTMKDEEQYIYKKVSSEFYTQYFPNTAAYTKSWEKPDVVSTNQKFDENQKLISNFDLLRKSFMTISKCHESFYRLRINFIQQYAMTVAAHYLLGIGDRHLKNFLINENTGDIIGIDFGYAFGIATIFLPIPELIPFRLTSSMVEFLKPSGVGGIFSQTLDNVLGTLGREQLTIMSIMHVFLTNQILDWHRMSRMSKQSIESFTQKRINISHRKLKREDPLLLLYEELQIKYGKSNWFKCMKNFQSEDAETSQTKKLVSMATNSGFLARTWQGFEPVL